MLPFFGWIIEAFQWDLLRFANQKYSGIPSLAPESSCCLWQLLLLYSPGIKCMGFGVKSLSTLVAALQLYDPVPDSYLSYSVLLYANWR